jgi:hypothetical protein
MLEDKSTTTTYSYPLRSSTTLLVIQIILVQVSLMLITSLASIVFVRFSNITVFTRSFEIINLLAIFGLQVVNVLATVIMFLSWLHTVYLVKPDQIVEQRGILNIKETIYSTDPAPEVMVFQSLFGRLCNYGTLEIINPLLSEHFRVENIPHPYFYASIIKNDDVIEKRRQIRYFPLRDMFKTESMPRTLEV